MCCEYHEKASVVYPHLVCPIFFVSGWFSGEFLVVGVVVFADFCLHSWRWYEFDDLFVAVYLEPAFTDGFLHGGKELVASLVLDWRGVSDCVFEEFLQLLPL